MAAPSKTGMELMDMKQLLNKAAPDSPVPFAFGMGAEPGFALLMLDKVGKNPKGVHKTLEETFKDAKNTRWGTAIVDPAVNASLVKFTVNKAVSGMAKRLVKTMKGTGYNRAEILLEDGTVVEGASEDEEVTAGSESHEGETQEGPVAPGGVAPPPPPPPMPTAKPTHDAGELQRLLVALVPRIPQVAGTNAELLAQFKKFATDATVALKTNNLVYAATAISQLSKALDAAHKPPEATGVAGTGDFVKPREDWLKAHQAITGGIGQLRGELISAYQGEGIAADVEKRYDELVKPLLTTLDDSLAAKLEAAGSAPDTETRTKLIGEARVIMSRYAGALTSPVVADLDSNPFVKLNIQAILGTTLKQLSASIR